jgi:hypothetical protein
VPRLQNGTSASRVETTMMERGEVIALSPLPTINVPIAEFVAPRHRAKTGGSRSAEP